MELKGQMGYLGFIIWKGREKVGNRLPAHNTVSFLGAICGSILWLWKKVERLESEREPLFTLEIPTTTFLGHQRP